MFFCLGCSKGYRYDSANDECVICPANTYSNTTNAESCTSCPGLPDYIDSLSQEVRHMYTSFISEEGSTSRADCGKISL